MIILVIFKPLQINRQISWRSMDDCLEICAIVGGWEALSFVVGGVYGYTEISIKCDNCFVNMLSSILFVSAYAGYLPNKLPAAAAAAVADAYKQNESAKPAADKYKPVADPYKAPTETAKPAADKYKAKETSKPAADPYYAKETAKPAPKPADTYKEAAKPAAETPCDTATALPAAETPCDTATALPAAETAAYGEDNSPILNSGVHATAFVAVLAVLVL